MDALAVLFVVELVDRQETFIELSNALVTVLVVDIGKDGNRLASLEASDGFLKGQTDFFTLTVDRDRPGALEEEDADPGGRPGQTLG